MAKLWIGTSGWHYRHWVGPFYPPGTRAKDFLPYYAQRFRTVELNNTFYRLPAAGAPAAWRDATPAGFRFACKGSRFITHMKKLKNPAQSTPRYFAALRGLGAKLGPILFQLPPNWRANPDRLDAFLAALPARQRYAFEFRDESWFDDAIYKVLRRRRAACCVYDIDGRTAPAVATARFRYVRLHGPGKAYEGSYDARALRRWADRLRGWLESGQDVYCYFDNDQAGYAARDAARLGEELADWLPDR